MDHYFTCIHIKYFPPLQQKVILLSTLNTEGKLSFRVTAEAFPLTFHICFSPDI